MHKLFVYGTLKSQYYGHHYFNGPFTRAITEENFLVMGGSFPRAIRAKNHSNLEMFGSKLLGELVEISDQDLEQADFYEGYPSFYDRITIKVRKIDPVFFTESSETEEVLFYEAKDAANCFDVFNNKYGDDLEELANDMLYSPIQVTEKTQAINWKSS